MASAVSALKSDEPSSKEPPPLALSSTAIKSQKQPQWVYITQPKVTSSSGGPSLPTIQIPPGTKLPANITLPPNSGVILSQPLGKSQHQLLIQKPSGGGGVPVKNLVSLQPVPKSQVPLLLGPGGKLPKMVVASGTVHVPKKVNLKIVDGKVVTSKSNGTLKMVSEASKSLLKDQTYELSIVEDSSSNGSEKFLKYMTAKEVGRTARSDARLISLVKDTTTMATSQGVSILKKVIANSAEVRTVKEVVNNPVTTVTTQSDQKTVTSSTVFEPAPVPPPLKSERRRKSTFNYRKDFDDVIEPMTVSKPTKETPPPSPEPDDLKPSTTEEVIEKPVIFKTLSWDEDVATLPGTDLRFHINEFKCLEMLTPEEYRDILDKRARNGDAMRCCYNCSCYGLPAEFINSKYCSKDCQIAGAKKEKADELERLRRKRRREKEREKREKERERVESSNEGSKPPSENVSEDEGSGVEAAAAAGGKKRSYPWMLKKGFSWSKYLTRTQAQASPLRLFKDPYPYNRNGFRPGMKLEGVDPQHPSYFCVLSIYEVIGYRIRLHFDGYPETYDFWINADSLDIFPAGWCEKNGRILHPPPPYTSDTFNWNSYVKETRSTLAPKHLFANRAANAICPNGFRVGMKLEAVDRKNNTSLVCVATVADTMGNRILVHFESWDDIYDYWADPTSPHIHQVGWCDSMGHRLTPPHDYPDPKNFTWEKYLKETKSVAAPVRAFKQRPACGFRRGMKLECVDRRVPQLIRVATVDDVKDHRIRISFDGWRDRYSFWVDEDCQDIHPAGWAQKTGHPIEPPLTPDDVYDFAGCSTVGCKGLGSTLGPKYHTHSSPKYCPYSEENMDHEPEQQDRLLSPDREVQCAIPVSREPKRMKPKTLRPPKFPRLEPKPEPPDDSDDCKDSIVSLSSPEKTLPITINPPPLTNGYTNKLVEHVWERHSFHLRKYAEVASNPREWGPQEVARFVSSLPFCADKGEQFVTGRIDGEALLMLSQQDLVEILHVRLGPAIQLYNVIVMLRRKFK